mgnify:CR=1 FL=1|tara:strand:+ start:1565 stop:1873 length:309 start_codon:yes stop_codon:yes gene_type:complete
MKILEQQEIKTTQEKVYNFVINKFYEMGWLGKEECQEIIIRDYKIMQNRYQDKGTTLSRSNCDMIARNGEIPISRSDNSQSAFFDMFTGISNIILEASKNED